VLRRCIRIPMIEASVEPQHPISNEVLQEGLTYPPLQDALVFNLLVVSRQASFAM
jgi:hypothetical protein